MTNNHGAHEHLRAALASQLGYKRYPTGAAVVPTDAPETVGGQVYPPSHMPAVGVHPQETGVTIRGPEPGEPRARPPAVHVPKHYSTPNRVYDSIRTEEKLFRYVVEYSVSGSVAQPAAGANTLITVTLTQPANLRLLQQPNALHGHLVIRTFNASPDVLTGTGAIQWAFVDSNGAVLVLSEDTASGIVNQDTCQILTTPITDPTIQVLGQLRLTTRAGAVGGGNWYWSLGFSFAYVQPGGLFIEEKE